MTRTAGTGSTGSTGYTPSSGYGASPYGPGSTSMYNPSQQRRVNLELSADRNDPRILAEEARQRAEAADLARSRQRVGFVRESDDTQQAALTATGADGRQGQRGLPVATGAPRMSVSAFAGSQYGTTSVRV